MYAYALKFVYTHLTAHPTLAHQTGRRLPCLPLEISEESLVHHPNLSVLHHQQHSILFVLVHCVCDSKDNEISGRNIPFMELENKLLLLVGPALAFGFARFLDPPCAALYSANALYDRCWALSVRRLFRALPVLLLGRVKTMSSSTAALSVC